MMESADLSALGDLAVAAARAGGDVLRPLWRSGRIEVDARVAHDVKLRADMQAESAILDVLSAARPGDAVLTEESGASGSGEGLWIIDPLDGTVNFSHRHPHFSVSIAWAWKGRPQVGAVYDPIRDEMFCAVRGGGAWCNGERIHVSSVRDLGEAMLSVGYGKVEPQVHAVGEMRSLGAGVQKIRVFGSAALDFAYTACGRLDGYCEYSVSVWDIAAGAVILAEAGGTCRTWTWPHPYRRRCLVSNGLLDTELLALLRLDPSGCTDAYDH